MNLLDNYLDIQAEKEIKKPIITKVRTSMMKKRNNNKKQLKKVNSLFELTQKLPHDYFDRKTRA